jgi:hypothetical protein
MGPQLRDQCAVKEICHPGELPWSSAHSSCVALVHFRPPNTTRFQVFSTCTCRAQGCWWRQQRVSLLSELVSVQHVVVLLPDPCLAAHGRHLSAQVPIIMCQVPPRHAEHEAVGMKSLQTTGRPADLVLVCFNCCQSIFWNTKTHFHLYRIAPNLKSHYVEISLRIILSFNFCAHCTFSTDQLCASTRTINAKYCASLNMKRNR